MLIFPSLIINPIKLVFLIKNSHFLIATIVKPLYNNIVFAAKHIIIKGVLLYAVFVYKMHPRSKLGNNIVYLRL